MRTGPNEIEELAVTGLTANPTISEHAIATPSK